MRIISIEVANYRNLGRTKINIDGIVGLLSMNNFGKSNFLEAIGFALYFIRSGPDTRSRMMENKRFIPLVPKLANNNFEFTVEFEDNCFIKYGFAFRWENNKQTSSVISNEFLQIKNNETGKYSSYIRYKNGKPEYKTENNNHWSSLTLDHNVLAIDVLPSYDRVNFKNEIKSIKKFKYVLSERLDLEPAFMINPFIKKNYEDIFDLVDEDVASGIWKLKELDNSLYEQFKQIILNLFPEFLDIAIHEYISRDAEKFIGKIPDNVPFVLKKNIYKLLIKSRFFNQPVPVEMMSKGTQRIIWIVLNVLLGSYYKGKDGLGLLHGIDEIETSIHPRLIKKLLRVFSDEKTNVLFSTHSPILAQYIDLQSLYIGLPDDDGVSTFRKFKKGKIRVLENIADKRGMTAGEYIFELLSGSEDEISLLNTYLKETKDG